MRKSLATAIVLATTLLLVSGCGQAAKTPGPLLPLVPLESTSTSGSAAGTRSVSTTHSRAAAATPAAPLDPIALGRGVFLAGVTSDGDVKFTGGSDKVGNGACANCHGTSGGGGTGPMISWNMLTSHAKMANMPKFVYSTPDQVVTAIETGVRPNGTQLKTDMPRYALPSGDALGVIAYLRTLP